MPATASFYKGTPESAALFQPWISTAPISWRVPEFGETDQRPQRMGEPLGYDLRSRGTYHFDPWFMKLERRIKSTRFLVLGDLDQGKSTLLKVFVLRMMGLQAGTDADNKPVAMRARTNNRKPEEGEPEDKLLNDYLLGDIIKLNQTGLINIFDPAMDLSQWDVLETAVNVSELASGQPLVGFQPLALQVGVHKMLTDFKDMAAPEFLEAITRVLEVDDVTAYFQSVNSQILASLDNGTADLEKVRQLKVTLDRPGVTNIPEHEFRRDAALASTYLGRVLRGDFGQIFGGSKSLKDVLGRPMVTFDWSGLNGKARSLLDSMLFKWGTAALNAGNFDLIPHIQTHDEAQERLTSVMEARFWSERAKKARASHECELVATQYLSDISRAGDQGSEIRSLAGGVLDSIGGYFLFKPADTDRGRSDMAQLGLSEPDIYTLTSPDFGVGCFGFYVPGHAVAFGKLELTSIEEGLVQTNKSNERMMRRRSLSDMPDYVERAEHNTRQ